MSAETDRLPPVPQLVAPLISNVPNKWELRNLRFDVTWLQWFIQLRAKVDVINEALVSFGGLSGGAGFISQSSGGTFASRTINGTVGRVSVTFSDGSGDPVIDIDSDVAFVNVSNTWTSAQTFSSAITLDGAINLNTSPKYTVSAIIDAADDTAAATAGVPVGGTYRTGSILKLRVS
jgi:hypothetical protein